MNFGPKETAANGAAPQRDIVLRFTAPDHFFDCLVATCASLDVDIQITAGTDEGATVCLLLCGVAASVGDPAREGGKPTGHIVP